MLASSQTSPISRASGSVSPMAARIFSMKQSGSSSATSSRQPEAPAFSQWRTTESGSSMI